MPKKSRKTCKHVLYYKFSRSTLSSDSETFSNTVRFSSVESHSRLPYTQAKSDYLSRLFEKKKLKEKSLSKKLQTPFDRKLNRSCWPIELSKISRIKKKPKEKKKGKPHYKSIKTKISNSVFMTRFQSPKTSVTDSDCSSEIEDVNKDSRRRINPHHFFYEPVTPEMLMGVLQDPEHLKSGATLDMIIAKLRALKLDLNPTMELLKEEVLQKLRCAMTLGMVVETDGYYRVVCRFRIGKLSRKKVDAFWDLWHRQPAKFNRRRRVSFSNSTSPT